MGEIETQGGEVRGDERFGEKKFLLYCSRVVGKQITIEFLLHVPVQKCF